jgi:hypothetical protein
VGKDLGRQKKDNVSKLVLDYLNITSFLLSFFNNRKYLLLCDEQSLSGETSKLCFHFDNAGITDRIIEKNRNSFLH